MKYIILLNDYEPFETDDPIDELLKQLPEKIISLHLSETRPIIGGMISTWMIYGDHRWYGKIIRKYQQQKI